LSAPTLDALAALHVPLHVQVFVTPTCPYCPRAMLLAHKLAFVSEHVRADAIDASAFPELAARYGVRGVPRTIANEASQPDTQDVAYARRRPNRPRAYSAWTASRSACRTG
jgi:thiol-disulfide isomerase/thioredoxin